MPLLTLTGRNVPTLSAIGGRRTEYFDADLAGLSLRVTADGVKTWTLSYRHKGRKRRLTLGRFPDLSLADARKQAIKERGRVASGTDPGAEKVAGRAKHDETVAVLFDLYRVKAEKKRSWPEERRIFENEVLPVWRHKLVSELTRRDVRELVERKAKTAPVMANRILSRISRILNFAVEQDWIDANPALRVLRPGEETSRDRLLSREELPVLWRALHETGSVSADGKRTPRLSAVLNDAFLTMLLTAQRCGEVCRMRWDGAAPRGSRDREDGSITRSSRANLNTSCK